MTKQDDDSKTQETELEVDLKDHDETTFQENGRSGNVENNRKVSAKTILQLGSHEGDVIINESFEPERIGLPICYRKIYIENVEKYALEHEVETCKSLLDSNELSVITCVESNIIHALTNELFSIYTEEGFEVQQLLFNDYDRSEISLLIEDLKKGHIKRDKKLLLFIKNGSKYAVSGEQTLLNDLEKKGIESVSQYVSSLHECNCKVVYFANSNHNSKIEFSYCHVNALRPFLRFEGKAKLIEKIQHFQTEKKLPTNEKELLGRLKILFEKDNFEEAVLHSSSNKTQFSQLIDKAEIYPFVLFVATFFRGLEFDEFEKFLFLLIRETKKKNRALKLIGEWHKKADKILRKARIDNRMQTNLRTVDFNEESDANKCKKILIQDKRFFLDRMAKFIASPHCFYHDEFRYSTVGKINFFLADFGQHFGQHYTYEIPLRLLDEIELKSKKLKNLQKSKDELSQAAKAFRITLNRLLNLKEKEASYELFKSINNVQLSNPKLIRLADELNIQKFLIGGEIELEPDFNTEKTIKEFRKLRAETLRLLDECNQTWIKCANQQRQMIQRFSDFLIEMERLPDGEQLVNQMLNDTVQQYYRYSSILDILTHVHFKSGRQVMNWFRRWLLLEDEKANMEAFFSLMDLIEKDQTNFFNIFTEMSHDLSDFSTLKDCSAIEKKYHLVIFFHLHLRTAQNKAKSNQDETDRFLVSLFNTSHKDIETHIDRLLNTFLKTDMENIYREIFPDGHFLRHDRHKKSQLKRFVIGIKPYWNRVKMKF